MRRRRRRWRRRRTRWRRRVEPLIAYSLRLPCGVPWSGEEVVGLWWGVIAVLGLRAYCARYG